MTTTLESRRLTATTDSGGPTRISLEQTVANTFTMAYRGLLKIKHNPEQLFDVIIQPIIFTLMFTYIFGGADLRRRDGLSADHHPRHPRRRP